MIDKLLQWFGINRVPRGGKFVGRVRTHDDTAIKYRMGAGSPGDVTRYSNSAVIEPCLIDVNAPPTAYGQPVLVDATTQGVRPVAAGDTAVTRIYGLTVRPFPLQENSASPTLGTGTPPTSGTIGVLRSGYGLGKMNVTGAVKGGRVYVWCAATAGSHVQGQFEIASSSGKTLALDENYYYNGTEDANKVVEISVNA